MRFVVSFAVAVAAGAISASIAATAPTKAACTPGTGKSGNYPTRTFCGTATATAKVGGKTLVFKGGECAISQGYWTVNIGTIELGAPSSAKKLSYFGSTLMRNSHADGTYSGTGVSVSFNVPGKGYLVTGGTLTLKNGGKSATFSGSNIFDHTKASGTITC
jgi:hypothetical protein